MAEHVRVHSRHSDPGRSGQMLEPAGRGVPVHPRPVAVAQDRTSVAAVDGAVECPGHCWRERGEDDLAALATYP
jgi:hypothetical protein